MAHSRYIMYLTGQHPIKPGMHHVSDLTHVALAFMGSKMFNEVEPPSWPLFMTVDKARSHFAPKTAIMVAIGGWGDQDGFDIAAATDESRKRLASNVKTMVDVTGADGVDIDWEYPGTSADSARGDGEDYKKVPNSEKAWEIEAYPILLAEIRSALGPHKIISAAVPGLERDVMGFTKETIPRISASLDFSNVMTYDLMNRRDNVTKHHTGLQASLDAVNAYKDRGLPFEKMNLGFAFYIKWYETDPDGGCDRNPIGCKTMLMEDPKTGADLGRAGAFSWHEPVPKEVSVSYNKAMTYGKYDHTYGGHYYWDPEENLWWSWETPYAITKKFPKIMEAKGLGGVFAWGLGEDADGFVHFRALTSEMKAFNKGYEGERSEKILSSYSQDEL